MLKRIATLLALPALALAALGAGELVVDRAGAEYNSVVEPPPYEVSAAAQKLHDGLFVADLHADSLLWNRDLGKRGSYGHVDLPRLADGGVALQVFGVVTQVPKNQNFERNRGDTDRLKRFLVIGRWPKRTWNSNFERARFQARKLERLEAASAGRLVRILDRAALERLGARRSAGEGTVGALLALEGAHALEGRLDNLARLHAAGLRMIGLAHFFDNEVVGSAHGVARGGLTDFGREVVQEAEKLGIAVDLAHASPFAIHEVARLATRPLVVSHTGVEGTCGGPRNLSDGALRAVASTGGVVGIALFPGAVCGADLDLALDAIEYAVRVVGADHVALGSDFDGAVTTPFDAAGLPRVTEGLLARGLGREAIAKIMGGNALRVLRQTLPAGGAASRQ